MKLIKLKMNHAVIFQNAFHLLTSQVQTCYVLLEHHNVILFKYTLGFLNNIVNIAIGFNSLIEYSIIFMATKHGDSYWPQHYRLVLKVVLFQNL